MIVCPYCEAQSNDDENNFCEVCFKPLKCINCRNILKVNIPICLKCGVTIITPDSSTMNVSTVSPAVNKFVLEERQSNSSAYRRIEGEFTDEAIDKAAMMFGAGRMPMRLVSTPTLIQQKTLPIKQSLPINNVEEIYEVDNIEDGSPTSEVAVSNSSTNKLIAAKYFRVHGNDDLISKIADFKGRTKKEQQERFMMMIVWSYFEIFNRPVPSKEYISNSLKKVKMYDSNFSLYFENIANIFFMNIDGGYELNPSGSSKVDSFIKDIEENSYQGYVFKQESTKNNKQAKLNKNDEQLVDDLIISPIDVGTLDVRSLPSVTHNAMFAVWSITKGIGRIRVVKIKIAYLYLTKRYTTVSVKQKGFTDALSRANNKHIFRKNPDGLYYLTEGAEQEVEKWISSGIVGKSLDLENDKTE